MRRHVLAGLGGLAVMAFAQGAAAYPTTKEECDAAGGAWVTRGGKGFCFMELDPMLAQGKGGKDCLSAGGVILKARDGRIICGKQLRGQGDPLRGLGLPQPDTE